VESFDDFGHHVSLGAELVGIFSRHEFGINHKKTRVQARAVRQVVTGLTVNRKVNVSRTYLRTLRSTLDHWKKSGRESVLSRITEFNSGSKPLHGGSLNLEAHIRGKIEFLRMVRGIGDPLHARYALAAKRLGGIFSSPIWIVGKAATCRDFLNEAVWTLVGYDAQDHVFTNGTAFALEGIGFVSALHVVSPRDPSVKRWALVRASHPRDEQPVTGFKSLYPFDLTVLETSAQSHMVLRRAAGIQFRDHQVQVSGFPSWKTLADKLMRAETMIVQEKILSGSSLASVAYPLLSGASGGPVSGIDGRVVGVIIGNSSHLVMPNGVISIGHIDRVSAQPFKPISA
jgi:hypothetical protein